jgi:hypothetical protein
MRVNWIAAVGAACAGIIPDCRRYLSPALGAQRGGKESYTACLETEPSNAHSLRPRLDHHLRMLFRIGQLGEGAFHASQPDMSRD